SSPPRLHARAAPAPTKRPAGSAVRGPPRPGLQSDRGVALSGLGGPAILTRCRPAVFMCSPPRSLGSSGRPAAVASLSAGEAALRYSLAVGSLHTAGPQFVSDPFEQRPCLGPDVVPEDVPGEAGLPVERGQPAPRR